MLMFVLMFTIKLDHKLLYLLLFFKLEQLMFNLTSCYYTAKCTINITFLITRLQMFKICTQLYSVILKTCFIEHQARVTVRARHTWGYVLSIIKIYIILSCACIVMHRLLTYFKHCLASILQM